MLSKKIHLVDAIIQSGSEMFSILNNNTSTELGKMGTKPAIL